MPPSPTGWFHVGNARTMLFNWLYARHTGGRVVLRFEDTDRARSTEDAIRQAEDVLRWLGIDWDEGPHRQTQRLDLYAAAAAELVESGAAYPCYCTAEELAAERERRQAAGLPLIYSGRCRSLTADERGAREGAGLRHVIRLAMPAVGTSAIDDVVRGRVEWENALLGDHVIFRSDGTPTYLFANPFDDIRMGDHACDPRRGPAAVDAPAARRLYGRWTPSRRPMPTCRWCSVPTSKKLSKRHGAVSVEEFRDRGVLPQALVNYLALVGWSFDDHTTFMTVPELVERFTLERVNSSPGVFDPEKLEWLNGEHLRALPPAEFTAALQRYLEASGLRARGAARARGRGGSDRAGEAPHAGPVRGVRRLPVRATGRRSTRRVGAGRGRRRRAAMARRCPRRARRASRRGTPRRSTPRSPPRARRRA